MPIKLIVAMFASLFAISNSVIAEECGHRSEDSAFIMDCISARYKAADQELNAIYSEAMKSLSSDGKKKLKESQEAWLKYRDAGLALITEVNRNTGSTGNFIIEDYRATLVKKRASELKYILSGPDAGPAEW
ncbi:MAG: lysozyme inhibitor LprI family protein [Candidatus Competibacteraceae bacterium]